MFEKGQLVVCVDDDPWAFHQDRAKWDGSLDGLRRGRVYTVRAIGRHSVTDRPGIFLEEIIRPACRKMHCEQPFYQGRFRPLPSSQIFLVNSMLVTKRQRIKIEAHKE